MTKFNFALRVMLISVIILSVIPMVSADTCSFINITQGPAGVDGIDGTNGTSAAAGLGATVEAAIAALKAPTQSTPSTPASSVTDIAQQAVIESEKPQPQQRF